MNGISKYGAYFCFWFIRNLLSDGKPNQHPLPLLPRPRLCAGTRRNPYSEHDLIHLVTTMIHSALLSVWTWSARYVQVALDTFNLYSVLREGNIDERGEGSTISSGSARVSNLPSEGSGASDNISKPAADAAAPPV